MAAFVTVHAPTGTFIPYPSPRLNCRKRQQHQQQQTHVVHQPTSSSVPMMNANASSSQQRPGNDNDIFFMSTPPPPVPVSRAVVWFRDGDLRLEDHPGFDSACEHTSHSLSHLFVCTPYTTQSTIEAVSRLQEDLQSRSSDLCIRWSSERKQDEAEAVLSYLLEFGAERVHVREDIESETRNVVNQVRTLLKNHGHDVAVSTWTDDLRDWSLNSNHFREMPDLFPQFLRWPVRNSSPILPSSDFSPPIVVPQVISMEKKKNEKIDDDEEDRDGENLEISSILQKLNDINTIREWKNEFKQRYNEDAQLAYSLEFDINSDSTLAQQQQQQPTRLKTKNKLKRMLQDEKYGEYQLKAYLTNAEHEQNLPDFGRSLGSLLQCGAVSPRRMRQIVIEFERQSGRLFRVLYRDAAKLILNSLDAREFTTLMARRDLFCDLTVDGTHQPRFWRWNGQLIRYIEEGENSPGTKRGRPPILLIHGFGASSFHFQKSIKQLKLNYHVYAIDLIGFGRSDKPPMQYTPAVWEALVWDFVRDVIRERVYVAGNSIGGIFASGFGTDAFPKLSAGICLINTAGPLSNSSATANEVANSSSNNNGPMKNPREMSGGRAKYFLRRWRWIRRLAGRFVLKSLQGRVLRTLNIVYPTNPLEEDSKLPEEIMRASYDYGAVDVLSSGLISPPLRSFETILKRYEGPLLVFNGVLDPLGNVQLRTEGLKSIFPNATVVTVQAGHCPHDEVADVFVESFTKWIEKSESMDKNTETRTMDDATTVTTTTTATTTSSTKKE